MGEGPRQLNVRFEHAALVLEHEQSGRVEVVQPRLQGGVVTAPHDGVDHGRPVNGLAHASVMGEPRTEALDRVAQEKE